MVDITNIIGIIILLITQTFRFRKGSSEVT